MSTDKRENVTFAERKEEFERQVQTAQTIAISGHMNPDGDCIGSCLGLYNYLKENYEGLTALQKAKIAGISDIDSFKRLIRGLTEKVSWQSDAASAIA